MEERANEGATMNPDSYYIIHGWMVTELGLKANDLLIYARIHNFTENSENKKYEGSAEYLAASCNCTRATVVNTLTKLTEAGLIQREDVKRYGRPCVNYWTTYKENIQGVKNFDTSCQDSIQPCKDSLHDVSKTFIPKESKNKVDKGIKEEEKEGYAGNKGQEGSPAMQDFPKPSAVFSDTAFPPNWDESRQRVYNAFRTKGHSHENALQAVLKMGRRD